MTEVTGGISSPRPTESQKPKERMSDVQLGNLISAVGNNEAKAITLLAMANGNIFNLRDLHRQVLNLQGENKGWEINKLSLFDYCRKSFSPTGVVKEIFNPDLAHSTYGYAITDIGKEIGIPLVGLLLDFSERHNISLNKLFGGTPSTALKIIHELVTSALLPVSEANMSKVIGKSANVTGDIFNRLKEVGLIHYEGIKANKKFSAYKFFGKLPEGELPSYKRRKSLTNLIFKVLQARPDEYLTNENIYDALPEDTKDSWQDKKNLLGIISNVCVHLVKNDYAGMEKFHHGFQTEISVSEEQRAILIELLEITDGIQNKDKEMLKKGRKLAQEFTNSPERSARLMQRAKEASGHAQGRPREKTKADILSLLYSHPGLTNSEILNLFKTDNRIVGESLVDGVTRSLEKDGSVRVVKEGSAKRFYVQEKTEEKAAV